MLRRGWLIWDKTTDFSDATETGGVSESAGMAADRAAGVPEAPEGCRDGLAEE